MAALDAAQKTQIYRILYRLNLSFARILDSCRELQGTGVFRSKFTRLHQAFAQELQAEINEEVLGILHGIELDDRYRFGKIRARATRNCSILTMFSFMPKNAEGN